MKSVLLVVGTRPEAIKLIPLYFALKKAQIPVTMCATFQHDDLLQQVFDLFQIVPEIKLNVMKKNQTLDYLTSAVLQSVAHVLLTYEVAAVVVQGDTCTTFASALAAYYQKIPVVHVEAGLRTGDIYAPFPEEAYRRFVSIIAALHCAPTVLSKQKLLAEHYDSDYVFLTGNTVVDALLWVKERLETRYLLVDQLLYDYVEHAQLHRKKLVLLTVHRRESFQGGLDAIFAAVKVFLQEHPDVMMIFPMHPNEQVQLAINRNQLDQVQSLYLMKALPYHALVYLLLHVHWVVTDSGGIQEEAISLGKKVVIVRDLTERVEGVLEGYGVVAGTTYDSVLQALNTVYATGQLTHGALNTLYGDGYAAEKIITAMQQRGLIPLMIKKTESISQLHLT